MQAYRRFTALQRFCACIPDVHDRDTRNQVHSYVKILSLLPDHPRYLWSKVGVDLLVDCTHFGGSSATHLRNNEIPIRDKRNSHGTASAKERSQEQKN